MKSLKSTGSRWRQKNPREKDHFGKADYFVLVVTPMFILCGVFYPISIQPEIVQSFVQVLPLTHAVALTRPLVAGQALSLPLLHVGVLLVYAVVSYYLAV